MTSSIEPRPHGGGNPRELVGHEEEFHRLMTDGVTRTIEEIYAELGANCTAKTLRMETRRIGYTFK